MESVLKRRTPPSSDGRKICKARVHAVSSSTLQVITTQEALEKLQLRFAQQDFRLLRIGDMVCQKCRNEASRAAAAPSPSPSRRSEVPDLVSTSPVAAAETAVALQSAPPLSAVSFSELNASHPWASCHPDAVLVDLLRIPELQLVFADLGPLRQRVLLSGIGKAMQPHLNALEAQLAQTTATSFDGFSSTVEAEFVEFCKSLRSLEPFETGSWARVEAALNSDECSNLRSLLRCLVSSKGSDRNFARQSAPVKLRKVGLVLLQLGKLRSERFSGFALKWSTYLHFRGVADEVSLLEIQLGLTVDAKTRRDALERWRVLNATKPVETLLLQSKHEVAFVGDNVNVFVGVRDIAASVKAKQLNMFASALWLRYLAPPVLARIPPPEVSFSFRSLMLDADGYGRVRSLLASAAQEVLQLGGVDVQDGVAPRVHVGELGAQTWIPFFLCERDSSRPAEMLEILKDHVKLLNLDPLHVWPFYGDMLTCRNVRTAAVYWVWILRWQPVFRQSSGSSIAKWQLCSDSCSSISTRRCANQRKNLV
jgi:hypothetical protein